MEKVTINGVDIPLEMRDFTDHNTLRVYVGTTGSDSSADKWSCRTYISLVNTEETRMWGHVENDPTGGAVGVSIYLEGDSELATLIGALEYAAQTLRDRSNIEELERNN